VKTAADVDREVTRAEERVHAHVRETYVEPSPVLSELTGADVYLKLENLQHTGSFKARGALNKILALDDQERSRGVVAASTGNHGAAVAWALRVAGSTGMVFVPKNAAATKLAAIERFGAEIRYAGTDCVESERAARAHADAHGMCYLSPYNDPQVLAGQGTIAAELVRQLDDIDVVFASLGGGGLLSGLAGALALRSPATRVVGVSPENSKVMIESVRAGRILDLPSLPTLSDGSAGGVEADSVTFPLVRDLVHELVTVSEDEIAESLRGFIDGHHMLIEGAAAAVLAGLSRCAEQIAGKRVVAVMCGGNIGAETLAEVLACTG
jgi:threonine dehydratase